MFYARKYVEFIVKRMFGFLGWLYQLRPMKLAPFLRYCSGHIPFYDGKGSALEQYGELTKKQVFEHFDSFVNRRIRLYTKGFTSGTTGTPAMFLRDVRSVSMEHMFQDRYFGWKGRTMVCFRGEKLFPENYEGSVIFKRVPLIREIYVSSYHITEKGLQNLCGYLSGRKNMVLWAYPSSAFKLAEYCLRNQVHLSFEKVCTSSETLSAQQVDSIEKAFSVRILDWYGQAERVAAFTRCAYGHYHPLAGYSHIEFIRKDDFIHEVLGTTINNRVMPLIRYHVADRFVLSEAPCACGSKEPNILEIQGRTSSCVRLPGGIVLYESAVSTRFKILKNIVESQIIQEKNGDIVMVVVKGAGFTAVDEAMLRSVIDKTFLGMATLQFATGIKRTENGKYQYIVQK